VTGVVTVLIGVRFAMVLNDLLDELRPEYSFGGRFDVLQYGTYLAVFGGLLVLVGGILALRKPR
jgi:hypothetical protein